MYQALIAMQELEQLQELQLVQSDIIVQAVRINKYRVRLENIVMQQD